MTAISAHAGPQFYYGPMPVPPTPAMVNPYFLSIGSGPLPVNSSPLMDRGGSLVSIPSGPYGGAAPSHVPRHCLLKHMVSLVASSTHPTNAADSADGVYDME